MSEFFKGPQRLDPAVTHDCEGAVVLRGDSVVPLLLTAEHAGNLVPDWIGGGDLGVRPQDMEDHIAYDPGTERLTRLLSEIFDSAAILQPVSRLVVDTNRMLDAPDLIPDHSDGVRIPANERLSLEDRQKRIERIYSPFHTQVRAQTARLEQAGQTPVIVSVHSFTPCLRENGGDRPWKIGVLWRGDDSLARPMIRSFRAAGMETGENQPYDLSADHGIVPLQNTGDKYPFVLLEVRNDLLASESDLQAMAAIIAAAIAQAVPALRKRETPIPAGFSSRAALEA